MFKKYMVFSFLIFILSACGTDYYYSSFTLRKDLQWFTPTSEQASINNYSLISAQANGFNQYTSPSIVCTPANYIVAVYESRQQLDGNLLGVDGNNVANVRVSISLNASSFKEFNNYVGEQAYTAKDSKGSPVTFLAPNGKIVVIAIGGVGLSDGTSDEDRSIIYKTKSENNGYKWDDWTEISTNTFEKLTKEKYDRYYTNPGNGIVLGNGTLACMIDFKTKGSGSNPQGAAIFYSTDGGENWQIGGKMMYSGHRSARIIAERADGSLLIAAVPNISGTDYNTKGALKWGLAKTINSDIEDFTVTFSGTTNPFEKNSAGTVCGDKIRYTCSDGTSGSGIILIHSWDHRTLPKPNGGNYETDNSSAISISKDDGKTWTMITNIVGLDPHPKYKASFRQSMFVLKDGTIALAIEEGNGETIDANSSAGVSLHFTPTYRRVSLDSLSEGVYKYGGL